MTEIIKFITGGAMGVLFMFAAPITWVLAIIDTWGSNTSTFVKIIICVTLDAFLATIWPITWVIWTVMHLAGKSTPISTVLGF